MKYIDAERLRAELEKRLKNVRDYINGAGMKYKGPKYYKAQGKESVYDALLSVIYSLQQEQPDNEDVDKVAQELYEHLYELKRRNNVPTNLYDKQEIIDLWKAGIIYGRSHPKQEQPEVDLNADIEMEWNSFNKHLAEYGEESEDIVWLNWHSFNDVARHFYELGHNARNGN